MKNTIIVLAACTLASHVTAQVDVHHHVAPWFYNTYAEQLGRAHFPGGGASGSDVITAVRALPSGSVVVAGSTTGSLGEAHAGPSSTADIFVARFGPLGDLEWISQVGAVTGPTIPALNGNPSGPGGDATDNEQVSDIAIADDGSIFLTGTTWGNLGETNAGVSDIVVAKFNAAGSLQWLRQIGAETAPTIPPQPGATLHGSATSSDVGRSIILHPSGGVTIGGNTDSSLSENVSATDFVLARFDGSGNLQWLRQMGAISSALIGYYPGYFDNTARIAKLPSGQTILGGMQWNSSGTLLAQRPVLMRFDDTGHPLAYVMIPGVSSSSVLDLAVDPLSGRVALCGQWHSNADTGAPPPRAWAALFNANLSVNSQFALDAAATAHLGNYNYNYESFTGVAFDSQGNLFLCGVTGGSLDEPNAGGDIFTMKIPLTGPIAWVSQLGQTTGTMTGFGTGGNDQAGIHGLAIGPGGMIVIGGSTTGNFGEVNAGATDALLIRLKPNGKFR